MVPLSAVRTAPHDGWSDGRETGGHSVGGTVVATVGVVVGGSVVGECVVGGSVVGGRVVGGRVVGGSVVGAVSVVVAAVVVMVVGKGVVAVVAAIEGGLAVSEISLTASTPVSDVSKVSVSIVSISSFTLSGVKRSLRVQVKDMHGNKLIFAGMGVRIMNTYLNRSYLLSAESHPDTHTRDTLHSSHTCDHRCCVLQEHTHSNLE